MDSLCSTQNADLLEEGRGAFPEVQLTMVRQLHEVLSRRSLLLAWMTRLLR